MPTCYKYYVMICVEQRNNTAVPYNVFNHLKTKRRRLYLKTQSELRSKHFSSRL